MLLLAFNLANMINLNRQLKAAAASADRANQAKTDFLSTMSHDIRTPMNAIMNISQPMVREKNIDFNFRINRFEHEYLYADQLRINQIYINLLSNAVKYTEPGGRVCVDMRQEKGETDKTVRLVYVVADTGMGMTPEFMAKMYQPFSRQTDSRVNTIQGTGLGLTITKQMIDLMHGTIDCQSEVGKGTTFTVTLEIPLADKLVDEMLGSENLQTDQQNEDADLIYTDEATFESPDIRKITLAHFKPDFAPDNLLANNYICHFKLLS